MLKTGLVQQKVRDLSCELRELADELEARADRIAAVPSVVDEPVAQGDILMRCRELREHRRRRRAFFPAELFHEPAWDMLLTLYVARAERRTMHVKTLVSAADAPITTSQRWIEQLARLELVVRTDDVGDRRRVEVALSDKAAAAIERYLADQA
ncbi:hypothetical protein ACFSGX_09315 [Sphingomonas arantia]|uniref:MarR family transcriptional regulator n=1 Tax=Sphingomonas arantia TaxID=1460676 RepID=A0ABW4U095_9SPHN